MPKRRKFSAPWMRCTRSSRCTATPSRAHASRGTATKGCSAGFGIRASPGRNTSATASTAASATAKAGMLPGLPPCMHRALPTATARLRRFPFLHNCSCKKHSRMPGCAPRKACNPEASNWPGAISTISLKEGAAITAVPSPNPRKAAVPAAAFRHTSPGATCRAGRYISSPAAG